MSLFSSTLLIRTHSLTLLTVAYFLLYNPSTLQDAGIAWILGEAMHIPESSAFTSPSPLAASIALTLIILALTHFVFASQIGNSQSTVRDLKVPVSPDLAGQALGSWMLLSGFQVLGSAGTVAWMYLKCLRVETSYEVEEGIEVGIENIFEGVAGLGLLVNRVVFAGAFVEMLFWGYIYSTLREESRELAVEFAKRAKNKEEDDF